MSDATRRPAVSHWFACSCDLLREMEAAGLDAPAVVLNVAAWTYAAVNMTDGVLTTRETARLPYATPRRRNALETTGFWHRLEDGRIELVGYLDLNDTRARIQTRQAQARERQQRARERAADETAEHDSGGVDDGTRHAERHASRHGPLPSPSPSPLPKGEEEHVNDGPEEQDGVIGGERQDTSEATALTPRGPQPRGDDDPSSSDRARGRVRRRERDSAAAGPPMPRWEDKPWEPVRDAWEERGLTFEPKPGQRKLLWPVLVEFPDRAGDWVAEAPVDDSSSYGVVAHVLAAATAERLRHRLPDLFAELSEEERARWLEAEGAGPQLFGNPMREARQTGEGLPTVAAGENPFRLALPKMVKEHEDLLAWLAHNRRAGTTTEGTGDGWTTA
jgi:hypothetical protein